MPRVAELRELTRHRTLAFVRQPEAVFWVFAFPIILATVLGFAFQSNAPAPNKLAIVSAGEPAGLAGLTRRLEADELLELEFFETRDDAERAVRAGRVDALLLDPDATPPTLRLDPTRPEGEVARLRVLIALGELDESALPTDEVQERGSRYIDFLFPGLIGMNLMSTGLWALGFAVADLRQRRVMKRLLVTPMRRSSFLLSFLLSRMQFLAAEVVVLTSFGLWVLDVPLRASLFQYGLVCLLGAIGFSGLGLLCSSRVKTIEGVSGMLNLIMIPMWLGSGVFFSYERFPAVIQPILKLLPLTAVIDALRATMLEGSGLGAIVPELGVLAIWTVVPFLLALRFFRWE